MSFVSRPPKEWVTCKGQSEEGRLFVHDLHTTHSGRSRFTGMLLFPSAFAIKAGRLT
jgi:hypothetical protein